MWTNIRYIFLTAARDRLFFGVLIATIAAALISAAMGQTAMVEAEQMTLSFAAGSTRMILAVGLIVFACFHVKHAFESKEIDVLLSRPVSRVQVVLSYWLGFAFIALVLIVPVALSLWLLGLIHVSGFAIWVASLICEMWLVVAIALFAAFTLGSAVSAVLSSLGFYVLSRMMGFFVATADEGILFSVQAINLVLKQTIYFVSMVIPRLDFFGKSNWLIYGVTESIAVELFLIQTAIFVPLLIVMAMFDFKRKSF